MIIFHVSRHGLSTVIFKNKLIQGTSLVVQWLRLCTSTAGAVGSIPGQETKIPHAARHSQKKKKKNLFMFINMLHKLCIALDVRTRMGENLDFRVQ